MSCEVRIFHPYIRLGKADDGTESCYQIALNEVSALAVMCCHGFSLPLRSSVPLQLQTRGENDRVVCVGAITLGMRCSIAKQRLARDQLLYHG